jgi:hypothetical protein
MLSAMAATRYNTTSESSGEGAAIEAFIARWQGREGGQERANYAMFLTELCAALGLSPPEPASATTEENDYTFERVVKETGRDATERSAPGALICISVGPSFLRRNSPGNNRAGQRSCPAKASCSPPTWFPVVGEVRNGRGMC